MIYLDNSATTRAKPKSVIAAVTCGLTKYSANPGRGGHRASIEAGMQVNKVREKLRMLVNAEKIENIIFTSGCTEALNLAILGSARCGNVICTVNDHNSVLRPLFHLAKEGIITVNVAKNEKPDKLCWNDIEKQIQSDTYLVCVNHISNVDGMETLISEIGAQCKKRNLLFLVDAAQSLGHTNIDIQRDNIDFLAIAPHKGLYAPQGIGALICKDAKMLKPIKFGGTGTESFSTNQPAEPPECFESGTIALPNILGLGAGIDFLIENYNDITEKIEDLTTFLHFELRKISNVIIYTHPDNSKGVLAFNIKGMTSEEVCNQLNEKYNICVRGGLHCAPLKHQYLDTLEMGIVRASISFFNDYDDILGLIKAVYKIAKQNSI